MSLREKLIKSMREDKVKWTFIGLKIVLGLGMIYSGLELRLALQNHGCMFAAIHNTTGVLQ